MARARAIVVVTKDSRYMVPKHIWIQRIRFVFGKGRVEAQISWTHAEKVFDENDIEYGMWKGKINKYQWPAEAEKEWQQLNQRKNQKWRFDKKLNRARARAFDILPLNWRSRWPIEAAM